MSTKKVSLLVVDDNEDNRDLLVRRLERASYAVETAADGETALRMIRRSTFDLVVLDLMMLGMSGMEVLEKIRKKKSKLELPVLIATAQPRNRAIGQRRRCKGIATWGKRLRHKADRFPCR